MTLPNDVFLKKLNVHIEEHLSDTAFTVTHLLRGIGMSRTDLHRKLAAKSGMSTTEYIRYIRVQHAALLLTNQPEWSLTQIAYEVGFSSLSYFTRTFIEVYGICPSVYRKSLYALEHT